jgi:hypothetical protein
MDWEEALLLVRRDTLAHASQYRDKANRAREMAEETTTRAVKTRLLADARRFDEIARSMEPQRQNARDGT